MALKSFRRPWYLLGLLALPALLVDVLRETNRLDANVYRLDMNSHSETSIEGSTADEASAIGAGGSRRSGSGHARFENRSGAEIGEIALRMAEGQLSNHYRAKDGDFCLTIESVRLDGWWWTPVYKQCACRLVATADVLRDDKLPPNHRKGRVELDIQATFAGPCSIRKEFEEIGEQYGVQLADLVGNLYLSPE